MSTNILVFQNQLNVCTFYSCKHLRKHIILFCSFLSKYDIEPRKIHSFGYTHPCEVIRRNLGRIGVLEYAPSSQLVGDLYPGASITHDIAPYGSIGIFSKIRCSLYNFWSFSFTFRLSYLAYFLLLYYAHLPSSSSDYTF